ncbi:MAG: single-stranded DNA-binding protein [Bacteroidia bacterium]
MSLNKVLLIGNLGQDPSVRYLENNKVVASFTLATNETYTDRNGERKTETEWHNIEMWDQMAKNVDNLKQKGYLKKGTQVYIEGKIRTENYKDKEGIDRVGKKIRALTLTLLGGVNRPQNESADMQTNRSPEQNQPNSPSPMPQASPVKPEIQNKEEAVDDLPF